MKTYFLLALLVAMPAAAKTALPEMTRSQSDLQYSDLATVWDEALAVKEEMLNRNEGLKSMYMADDDNMAVLYVTNATARFFSFGAHERKVNF